MKLITVRIEEQKDGTWIIERGIPGERKTFKNLEFPEMFYRGIETLVKIMQSPARVQDR